jgi:hypothetical protein
MVSLETQLKLIGKEIERERGGRGWGERVRVRDRQTVIKYTMNFKMGEKKKKNSI